MKNGDERHEKVTATPQESFEKQYNEEKQTNVRRHDDTARREMILDGVSYRRMYRMFRKDGLSVSESVYNALYLCCHNRYSRSALAVKDRFKSFHIHPAWNKDKTKLNKGNIWSLCMKALDFVAGFVRGFDVFVKKPVCSLFSRTLRFFKRIDSSSKAFKASLKLASFVVLPLAAVAFAVGTASVIAEDVSTIPSASVYIDGIYVGNTLSVNDVYKSKQLLESDLSLKYGTPVVLECDISFETQKYDRFSEILPGDTSVFNIYTDKYTKDGYGLYIDNKLAAVTSDAVWFEMAITEYLERKQQSKKIVNADTDRFIYNNNITITQDKFPESFFLNQNEVRLLFSLPMLSEDELAAWAPDSEFSLKLDYSNVVDEIQTPGSDDDNDPSSVLTAIPSNPISIDLAVERDERERVKIDYKVDYIYDEEMIEGMRRLVSEGKTGEKLVYYRAVYSNDKLVNREVVAEEILNQSVNRVVRVGTKELPADQKDLIPSGTYIYPYRGTISSEYGWRILRGQYNYHQGLDIYGPYGSSIVAADAGEVIDVGYSGGYGNYCLIRHNEDTVTRYAHCSKVTAKEGDLVAKGDEIAYMGSTGNVTGVHVHFEIIVNGETVDPAPYIDDEDLPYAY